MENKIYNCSTILSGLLFCITNTGFAKIKPTDILGRELDQFPLGNLGHVAIATADQVSNNADYVVESLNEPTVLQINRIENFKKRSPYWGAKFGVVKNDSSGTRIINEGAFQTSLKCAEYTLTVQWKAGTGQWGVPWSCPKFRCDTFVNYLYWWGGYKLPTYSPPGSSYPENTLPRMIYNYVPYVRDEKFHSVPTDVIKIKSPLREHLTINGASIDQLEEMSFEEFIKSVDLPKEELSDTGVDNILKYSADIRLNHEKRLFLLDKLGFVVNVDMIPELIELFYQYQEDDVLGHMILRDTQDIYQQENWLVHNQNERKLLKNFYLNILNSKLSEKEKPIVIRGITSLCSANEILANKSSLDQLINSDPLDVSIKLALKIALAFKSGSLEKFYITDITGLLEKENKPSLDILFAGAVVGKLSNSGLHSLQPESKKLIQDYLFPIKYKFESKINRYSDDIVLPQSLGIWLEALALVNSTSYAEAAKYIDQYLKYRNQEEQRKYILGFSNSIYLKRAFDVEPSLINFKKNNIVFYSNTVGMPAR